MKAADSVDMESKNCGGMGGIVSASGTTGVTVCCKYLLLESLNILSMSNTVVMGRTMFEV